MGDVINFTAGWPGQGACASLVWRPIAEAPRDGTEIVVWDGARRRLACWSARSAAWIDDRGRFVEPMLWHAVAVAPPEGA